MYIIWQKIQVLITTRLQIIRVHAQSVSMDIMA